MTKKPLPALALDDIQIFCRVAESTSFTTASISLNVTPSAVSKAIRRLEIKLKLKLFHRSTRSIRLTEEGQNYYVTCRQSLERIQEIENHLLNNTIPRGTLRISIPDSLAINTLIPTINDFMEQHHNTLQLEVLLSTAHVNFMREDYDLAIRIGEITDPNLVARFYAHTTQKIVASPAYLQKHGIPTTPEELKQHRCIGLQFPNNTTALPWKINTENPLHLHFSILYSHPFAAMKSAIAGFGLVQLLDFTVDDAIQSGQLIEVLPNYRTPPLDIHLVYPHTPYVPAKVRAFIDYLFERLPSRK